MRKILVLTVGFLLVAGSSLGAATKVPVNTSLCKLLLSPVAVDDLPPNLSDRLERERVTSLCKHLKDEAPRKISKKDRKSVDVD